MNVHNIIKTGNVDALRTLLGSGYQPTTDVIIAIAETGNMNMMSELKRFTVANNIARMFENRFMNDAILASAIKSDNMDMVRFVLDEGCTPTPSSIVDAYVKRKGRLLADLILRYRGEPYLVIEAAHMKGVKDFGEKLQRFALSNSDHVSRELKAQIDFISQLDVHTMNTQGAALGGRLKKGKTLIPNEIVNTIVGQQFKGGIREGPPVKALFGDHLVYPWQQR